MGRATQKISRAKIPTRAAHKADRGGHSRARRRPDALASGFFRIAALCLVVIGTAGAARVALAADAAEASIDAWELRSEVKAERLVARTLEADRSSLAAPSRIEAVASQTLNMSRPSQVAYLELPSAGERGPTGPTPVVGAVESRDRDNEVLGTLMDLAASEAQVLLVGDVGLGSLQ